MVKQLQVFVSYSRDDAEIAHLITEVLERGGHKPWIDEQLVLGQRWKEKLKQAIVECDAFLILLSPAALESEWCQWEYEEALEQEKPVFPVVVKLIDELPEVYADLADIQHLDISNGITASNSAALVGGIFQAQPLALNPNTKITHDSTDPPLEYNMEASMTLTDANAVRAIDITEPLTRLPVPNQNPLPAGIKAMLSLAHMRSDEVSTHPIHMTMFTIGRGISMNLVIPEKRISKHHMSIYWANGRFFLVDYSMNGTWLNGERIQNNRPIALNAEFEHRLDLARTDTFLNFVYSIANAE